MPLSWPLALKGQQGIALPGESAAGTSQPAVAAQGEGIRSDTPPYPNGLID